MGAGERVDQAWGLLRPLVELDARRLPECAHERIAVESEVESLAVSLEPFTDHIGIEPEAFGCVQMPGSGERSPLDHVLVHRPPSVFSELDSE